MPFHKVILESLRNREHCMIMGHTQVMFFTLIFKMVILLSLTSLCVVPLCLPSLLHQLHVLGQLLLLGRLPRTKSIWQLWRRLGLILFPWYCVTGPFRARMMMMTIPFSPNYVAPSSQLQLVACGLEFSCIYSVNVKNYRCPYLKKIVLNLINTEGVISVFMYKAMSNFCHAFRVNCFKEKSDILISITQTARRSELKIVVQLNQAQERARTQEKKNRIKDQ